MSVGSFSRSSFTGVLTYAANHDAFSSSHIAWWDDLDYIGIDAYFNLTNKNNPTVAELEAEWASIIPDIADVSSDFSNKPVLFTEVGYRSCDGANKQPWKWGTTEPYDGQEQADCYNAMLNALWNKPFIAGIYPWMTYHDPLQDINGFDVLHKPAEDVFQDFYHRMDQSL